MDYAYVYGDPHRLYLNVTNRCTNRCVFCVRNGLRGLGGAELWGSEEPEAPAVLDAVNASGGAGAFQEIIWCGFGEPTFRLDLISALSPEFRRAGARVRLNTNGHGSLIAGRDILPELGSVLDEISVSLNAPNAARYVELSRPLPEAIPRDGRREVAQRGILPEALWEAMCEFLSAAPRHIAVVQASVVASVLTPAEIEEAREFAASLGIRRFRVR